MARITLDVSRFKKKIALIEKIVNADTLKNEIGETAKKYISGQVRLGKDVETQQKFTPLKESTIEKRKYLQNYNKTHPAYSSKRSNLTFTGQLIDSITFEKILGGVRLFFKDKARIQYKGKNKTYKQSATNSEIAEYQESMGRRILGINKQLEIQIIRKIKSFIRLVLRSY